MKAYQKKPRVYLAFYSFTPESDCPVHIKVDITSNIHNRISQIQTPNSPYGVLKLNTSSIEEARKIESLILKSCSKYKSENGKEWLVVNSQDEMNEVESLVTLIEDSLNIKDSNYVFEEINIKM